MSATDLYLTLITSLPYPGQLFTSEQTPCSRLKLNDRLKMLKQEHAEQLKRLEDTVQWSHQPIGRSDEQIVLNTNRFLRDSDNYMINTIVLRRMELRTAVSALRRRKAGNSAPSAGELWGVGRWLRHIETYWSEPTFRLEGVMPWLTEANRAINENDTVGLERLLLGLVWDHLGYVGQGHYYDFEAVVVYVLRWNVINRWTTYSSKSALVRYNCMVEEGLGEFAHVF